MEEACCRLCQKYF